MKLLSEPKVERTVELVGERPAYRSVSVRFNVFGLIGLGPMLRVSEEEVPAGQGVEYAGRCIMPKVLIDFEDEKSVEFDFALCDRRRPRWPEVTLDFEGRSYTLYNLLPSENKGGNVWLTYIDYYTEGVQDA